MLPTSIPPFSTVNDRPEASGAVANPQLGGLYPPPPPPTIPAAAAAAALLPLPLPRPPGTLGGGGGRDTPPPPAAGSGSCFSSVSSAPSDVDTDGGDCCGVDVPSGGAETLVLFFFACCPAMITGAGAGKSGGRGSSMSLELHPCPVLLGALYR